jgi:hypothetical protein
VTGVNILFMGWTAVLLARQSRYRPAWLVLVPLAVFCLYLPFCDNTNTGMETPLFMLLLLLSATWLDRGLEVRASILMGLACLVRPEGVLWIAAVLLYRMRRRELPTRRLLLPLLGILGAWGAVCWAYFGTPVPQNALAKCGWVTSLWGRDGVLQHAREVLMAFTLLPYEGLARAGAARNLLGAGWMVLPLALFLIGSIRLWRERSPDLRWSFFFVLYVLFFVAGRAATWPSWYAIPPGLALVVVGTHGGAALLGRLAHRPRSARGTRRLVWSLGPGLILVIGLASFLVWRTDRLPYYGRLLNSHGRTGHYLAGVDPQTNLLVMEIGLIGYLADRHIEDMAGIVSEEIMQLNRRRRDPVEIPEQVALIQPDYVVLPRRSLRELGPGAFGAWFGRNYECVFEALPYQTFRRREGAAPAPAGFTTR